MWRSRPPSPWWRLLTINSLASPMLSAFDWYLTDHCVLRKTRTLRGIIIRAGSLNARISQLHIPLQPIMGPQHIKHPSFQHMSPSSDMHTMIHVIVIDPQQNNNILTDKCFASNSFPRVYVHCYKSRYVAQPGVSQSQLSLMTFHFVFIDSNQTVWKELPKM